MATEPRLQPSSNDLAAARAFARFYTRHLGALHEGFLDSPFSLTEARVIYEIASQETVDTTTLSGELGLDPGYLSRVVKRLEDADIVVKSTSPTDRRVKQLALSSNGREVFAELDAASAKRFADALDPLSPSDRQELVTAMNTIQTLLQPTAESARAFVLRPPEPGDLGWVVQRHGAVYARELNWGEQFEGLVAGIMADFGKNNDPKKERGWIAEVDGVNAGSVFLVEKEEGVAQLRCLLVEPHARGLGIGRRLVAECTRFARRVGYSSIVLWTNGSLDSARRIYEAEGYELIDEETQQMFGVDFAAQTWKLDL